MSTYCLVHLAWCMAALASWPELKACDVGRRWRCATGAALRGAGALPRVVEH